MVYIFCTECVLISDHHFYYGREEERRKMRDERCVPENEVIDEIQIHVQLCDETK